MVEKTEMYIAIVPVIRQMFAACEIIPFRMFKYQNAIGFQYVVPEYQLRYFFNTRHIVWRIGKHNIILRFANCQEMERIVADNANLPETQLRGCGADKGCVPAVCLYGMNHPASARGKLVTDAAGSRKQIQHIKQREVIPVGKDIEQSFLREIRSWPER